MAGMFLGADVGATKTHALVADGDGRALGFGEAGPGNPDNVGYDGLLDVLNDSVQMALDQAGAPLSQIEGAGFGVGGFDWPSQREGLLGVVRRIGLTCPVEVANDAIIGLLAGAREGWGVAVVAGTGCNCWGWDRDHRVGRVTGLGWQMGEAAGAAELVEEAIRAISRGWSRRGPPTRLTERFIEYTGAQDVEDLLSGLSAQRYALGPETAPLIFRVAEDGDQAARATIAWAGKELGSLALGVVRQLGIGGEAFEVVLVGSLFDGGSMLIDPMRKSILTEAPLARLVRLTAPPVVGGVLLGMQQARASEPGARQMLIATVAGMLDSQPRGPVGVD
jgi:N-acetylglucosamine kinase-like BadF-type ATPase